MRGPGPLSHPLLLVSLMLWGCGGPAREPGFQPGELLDWTLSDTELSFEDCTDAKTWRDHFAAYDFRRRVVQVSESGQTAQLLICTSWSVSTCSPTDPASTLSVDGATMQYTGARASAIAGAPECMLGMAEDLQIVDHGHQMRETVRFQLYLLGEPARCAEVEAGTVAAGTNGLGIDGCRVTFRSNGRL